MAGDTSELTLAEERDLLKRLGPQGMKKAIENRYGIPCRMARGEIQDVSWVNGEVTIREFGDTATKTNVRWMPPYYPGIFDAVWYLKFGDDGIILGPSLGDYDEWASPDFAKANSADATASASTTSSTYSTPADGPTLGLWVEVGEPIEVRVECMFNINNAGAFGAQFSWRVLDGAIPDYGDVDADGCETGNTEWTPGSRTTIWKPDFMGNAELQFRVRNVNSTAGLSSSYKYRRIAYRRVGGYVP